MFFASRCIRLLNPRQASKLEITIDGAPRPRQMRQLLGAMLEQAMRDGATRIAFGVTPSNDTTLRYCIEGQWWDMVAPPPSCFALLFQIVVSAAEWRTELPMQGRLTAKRGSQRVEVDVTLTGRDSFELFWPRRMDVEWGCPSPFRASK